MSPADLPPGATHVVFNQPPPLEDRNLYEGDSALQEALRREGGGWAEAQVHAYGAWAGSADAIQLGFQANEYPPRLRTHDRYGQRIDRVEYHPAYHALMRQAIAHGLAALPWREHHPGAQVVRAALFYLHTQAEAGTCCPVTMTYACAPVLRYAPALAACWLPRITALDYEPADRPAADKPGITVGMAMTEKQGGSDVRANTTRAEPDGDGYRLTGHKWFCSAPMSDAFLTLAQLPEGLTCFWLPRWRPDGSRNTIHIQRLKDKLGNRSNASAEVEFHGAWAERIGEPGRGVATILEMVALTRCDCLLGSAGLMRQALTQALHHCRHRSAFGRLLAEQPLMRNVLADLALESEAALVLALRLARALDEAPADPIAQALVRLATALGKFWVCKRATYFIHEAQECLGGLGYIEESMLPRLYREAPVNSIWEGSGNIQCLDLLRALEREPQSRDALLAELAAARGGDRRLDIAIASLSAELADGSDLEYRARALAQRLALALQAALLVRHAPAAVADAFCASRLGGEGGRVFGDLPRGLDLDAILARAWT
ncbi:MAG TPA: isovaleryl-CoA dehydrogenase [Candidatus Competibacteraceae bacterium]|nr:isovaleryl-CoA dehydrogenase [Candidatus Competibacteraceae bacterium]